MGRKRDSAHLQAIKGNPAQRTRFEDATGELIAPEKVAQFRPPSWLSGKQRRAFRAFSAEVAAMQLLTAADREAMASLACEWTRYRDAQEMLNREGFTFERETAGGNVICKERPEVRILADARRACMVLFDRFGLTPAGRAGVKVAPKKATEGLRGKFGLVR